MKFIILFLSVLTILWFSDCKTNKVILVNNDCDKGSRECTVNITVIDTNANIDDFIEFVAVVDLSDLSNAIYTNFDGNATLSIGRPNEKIIPLLISRIGVKDTCYVKINNCDFEYYYTYYIPQWMNDSISKMPPPKTNTYNPHKYR